MYKIIQLILLLPSVAFAQIQINFEADTTAFCSPYTVTFNDLSYGGVVVSRTWIFGQGGVATGGNASPQATYTQPGSYDVTLVIFNGTKRDTLVKKNFIKVWQHPIPRIALNPPHQGCQPLVINTLNNSITGDAPITKWNWNFGDGNKSSLQQPAHIYNSPGKFTIFLAITDSNGCQADTSLNQLVEVYPKPVAAFITQGPSHACFGPLDVNFINQSSGNAPLQFSWQMGDGTTSNQADPIKRYYNGSYDVRLIVTDKNGCRDTAFKSHFASVGSAQAAFHFLDGDTLCLGSNQGLRIQNTSVGGAANQWDFGDGSGIKSGRNPIHNYTTTGTYTVRLTVTSAPNCSSSTTRILHVIQPTGDFGFSPAYACQPTSVSYFPIPDPRLNAIAYSWKFSNKLNSSLDSPVVTHSLYGQQFDSLRIFYAKGGGCFVDMIKPTIRLWYPSIMVTQSIDKGCAPLPVRFEDLNGSIDSIASWSWDFGDGHSDTGRIVTHNYTVEGKYYPVVEVRTKSGCIYRVSRKVRVGTHQNPDFGVDSVIACASHFTQFPNFSTDSTKIDEYFWSYGDGGKGGSRHGINRYKDTGFFSVRLIIGYNGCYDTLIKPNYLYRKGPVLHSNLIHDCNSPFERYLDSTRWVDVHRFYTNWGDSTAIDSVNTRPRHTYAQRGDYIMTTIAYNDSTGCNYFYQQEARIRNLRFNTRTNPFAICWRKNFQAEIYNDQDLALGSWMVEDTNHTWYNAYNYIPNSSLFFNIVNARSFSFETGRRRLFNQPLPEIMGEKRKWKVIFVGYDVNGCPDTTYNSIKFYGPEVKFSLQPDTSCAPAMIAATDSTSSDTTLNFWKYWLGDRNWVYTQNFYRKFIERGFYNVTLEVKDVLGCGQIAERPLALYRPVPIIQAADTQLCVDEPTEITHTNTKYKERIQWLWNSKIDTINPVQIQFGNAGKQTVQLYVIDSMGCDSTVTFSKLMVQKVPTPGLIATPADTHCYPAEIMLSDTLTDSTVVKRYWQPEPGASAFVSTLPYAYYVYQKPGIYEVKLTLETTFGCKDSFLFKEAVRVKGPYAEWQLPDTICIESRNMFLVQNTQNVHVYEWDFGDGIVDTLPGHLTQMDHIYFNEGSFPVTLILRDSAGVCSKWLHDTVYVEQVTAQFTGLDSVGCAPYTFEAGAASAKADIFGWWLHGNKIGSGRNLKHLILDTGSYALKLITGKSSTGCADEKIKMVKVLPRPVLRATDSRIVCFGDSVQLKVDGALSYYWQPSAGLSSHQVANPLSAPPDNTIYSIIGTAANGCTDTTTIYLDVVQQPQVEWPSDTTIFLGQTYKVPLNAEYQVSYLWTPATYLSCHTCANPEAKPPRNMTYRLTVKDKFGCFEIDSSFTIYVEGEVIILIPNAFTPNGDGLNDLFTFYTRGVKQLLQFDIFNRSGEKVYGFEDLKDAWDGKVRGEWVMQPQTFAYRGVFLNWSDEQLEYTGFIALIR